MFSVGTIASVLQEETFQIVPTTLSGSNRTLTLYSNGSTYRGWSWLTPNRAGAWADFEYRTTPVSGEQPSGGTIGGVWAPMQSYAVNLTFDLEYPGATDLSIRKKGTTTPVATGRITYLG